MSLPAALAPRTEGGQALAGLSYAVVDLYCGLRAISDRFAAPEGQTSARFAVLYVLVLRGPLTVAEIARDRGVARQGVQRLADELSAEGLTEFVPNPAHRRSMRLRLTVRGQSVALRIFRRQARAFDKEAAGLDVRAARSAEKVLRDVHARLRAEPGARS